MTARRHAPRTEMEALRSIPKVVPASLVALLAALLLLVGPAAAQPVAGDAHEGLGPESQVGDVPSGSGVIAGRVVHAGGGDRAVGLDLALYALQPDGSPGLREGATGPGGEFRFEGVSADPSVVYLIGARFAGIPFGRRVVFPEGQATVTLEIPVSDPVSDPSAIRVVESELRLEWVGARLAVQETHRLFNSGDRVVFVDPASREGARPAFETAVPENADGFFPGTTLFEGSLAREGDRVLHWGPVYPGDSEVQFQYWMSSPEGEASDGEATVLPWRGVFPAGAERLVVLIPEGGIEAEFLGLEDGGEIDREGRSYSRLEASPWAPGRALEGGVSLPAASSDASRVRVTRFDAWLELDGAALTVSQDIHLTVDGTSRIVSTDGPLLEFPLPEGAEFLGVSQDSRALGVAPSPEGGIVLAGPLPPGESRIAMRYRLPSSADASGERSVHFDLRFPSAVELLNVLIADTGVAVEDTTLHRRRPFRSGTRTYLHREGIQIEAGETISVRLTPLTREGIPRNASIAIVAFVALLAIGWVFRPLGGAGSAQQPTDDRADALARERASVYSSIHDLDHDHETGKIADEDYQVAREELRAEAVSLLREERREQPAPAESSPAEAASAPTDSAVGSASCPQCGQASREGWRFCAACGAPLESGERAQSGSGAGD